MTRLANICRILGTALVLTCGVSAHAVVERGGKTITVQIYEKSQDNPSYSNADYFLSVKQAPGLDFDGTGIYLAKTDHFWSFQSTLTPVTWLVDEEADFYLAEAGDVVSATTLAEGQFTPLFTTDKAGSIDVPYPGSFYLAIATHSNYTSPDGKRNVYGWAKLQNSYTGLKVVDSAMAYGEGGIVVGSFTALPLPEASTWVQMALGLGGVMLIVSMRRKAASAARAQRT